MNNEILNLTYASSLTDLCEINSSFDSGVLRIAYHGDNRNGSSISKEVFMNCIKTIYNCPVVCNYNRESDSIGGHDMEIVRSDDGSIKLVNLTQPVGVVPESAKAYWEEVVEDSGASHEYLCVEVLIWKRQEAYKKIKEDGITAQSMEITVKAGEVIDGVYVIKDFEFTAFALIGVEPCYESASLAFSNQDFKKEFSEMMLELKDVCKRVTSSEEDDDIKTNKYSMEGGSKVLDKQSLITKYSIDVDALDFSIDDFTAEELEEKFKLMSQVDESAIDDEDKEDKFALTSNIIDEIISALCVEKITFEWGENDRYSYVDCDLSAMEVYCWDRKDWLLYGFAYKFNGDHVEIDFDSKKRKKYAIVDFDEGELEDAQASPIAQIIEEMERIVKEANTTSVEFEEKYQITAEALESAKEELDGLRKFKADTENEKETTARMAELNVLFESFEDLAGTDAFEVLKTECADDCMKYELDVLEEKCYAIRGRMSSQAKFNLEQKAPKIPVVTPGDKATKPYGGIFEEYGFNTK